MLILLVFNHLSGASTFSVLLDHPSLGGCKPSNCNPSQGVIPFGHRSGLRGFFSEQNRDRVAFRKRSQSSAVPGMGGFCHNFPTLVQHARNVFVHCLHARKQPLPVVFPRPSPCVRKRHHFHLTTASVFSLALFPFRNGARTQKNAIVASMIGIRLRNYFAFCT